MDSTQLIGIIDILDKFREIYHSRQQDNRDNNLAKYWEFFCEGVKVSECDFKCKSMFNVLTQAESQTITSIKNNVESIQIAVNNINNKDKKTNKDDKCNNDGNTNVCYFDRIDSNITSNQLSPFIDLDSYYNLTKLSKGWFKLTHKKAFLQHCALRCTN